MGCLLGIAFASGLTISCARETKPQETKVRHLFVHGDPEELIRGSTFATESFFSEANLDDFRYFDFSIGMTISEFSEIAKDAAEKEAPQNAEEFGATSENRSTMRAYVFRSAPASAAASAAAATQEKTSPLRTPGTPGAGASSAPVRRFYEYVDPRSQEVALRGFADANGKVVITEMLGQKVELLHYSVTPDKRTFSLLGKTVDPAKGKSLVHAAFTQRYSGGSGPLLGSPKFSFLGGKGVVYRWTKPALDINICLLDGNSNRTIVSEGEAPRTVVSLLQEAWGSWQRQEKIGKLPARLKVLDRGFPPFSDVNTSCIYSIPKFAYETSNQFVTTGLTIPTTNSSLGTIEASTVFLFEQAIARAVQPRAYLGTAVHELGHFLGLGHEFEKNREGQYLNLSVMGYLNNGTLYPSEHDFFAVEELYGAYPPVTGSRSP